MKAWLFPVCACLVIVAAAAPGSAQNEKAPALSKSDQTLYAHHQTTDTAEVTGWANTLKADGDDTALGPAGSCGQHSGQQAVDEQILTAAGTAMDRTLTLTPTPAQSGVMKLDTTGKVTATIYVGAGSCFGKLDITVKLMAGATKVAEGTAKGHWFDNTAATYPGQWINMTPLVADVPLTDLVWTVNLKGSTGGSAFMGVAEAKGASRVLFPILSVSGGGGGTGPIHEVLQGAVNRTYSWPNATDQEYVYNWTTGGGPHFFHLWGDLSAGSLHVVLASEANELFNKTVEGTFNEEASVSPSEGVWTISVAFKGAVGNASLAIDPTPGVTASPTGSSGANGTAGNTTGASEGGEKSGGGIPFPAWTVIVAVAAGVFLRRRT